jgi:hypothetical protein
MEYRFTKSRIFDRRAKYSMVAGNVRSDRRGSGIFDDSDVIPDSQFNYSSGALD